MYPHVELMLSFHTKQEITTGRNLEECRNEDVTFGNRTLLFLC